MRINKWGRAALIVLALAVVIASAAVTGGNAATLHSTGNCVDGWKVALHIYGLSTVTNSTNVNYTVQGKNCGRKTLKRNYVKFKPRPGKFVVSPAGLQSGRLAMKNLRPHQRFTLKLVLNFPPPTSGIGYTFEVDFFNGSHEVGAAVKDVTVK